MSSLVAFTPTHFTIPNVSHVPAENDSSCLHAPGTSDNPATSGTAQPRNIYFNSTLALPTFPMSLVLCPSLIHNRLHLLPSHYVPTP